MQYYVKQNLHDLPVAMKGDGNNIHAILLILLLILLQQPSCNIILSILSTTYIF